MKEDLTSILVFATNIRNRSDKEFVSSILDESTVIRKWSIDQEDIDCVLRVVTNVLSVNDIIKIINILGFNCAELQ
ncbi:hypothetical protein [Flavobacterium pallidum]|uniref:Uncharacterized protein n=1 Tax=Flavobacterium pallidum TaxID=2172098 RepID=A0A2S1SHC8_9FLAO|nr:hypothetical protein [Flavobacterium pallidum]AWI25785.1 hypothetical protein HYN49_07655 [Flavobacterium pallidum]